MNTIVVFLLSSCVLGLVALGLSKLRNYILSKKSTYFDAAFEAYNAQKYVQAIELFNKSYKKSEIYRNTLYEMLAASYLFLGNVNEALKNLNALLEIDQSNINVKLKIACIHRDNNMPELYEEIIDKILKDYPLHVDTLCHAAIIYVKKGKHEKAIEFLEKILNIDSTNLFALSHLAIEYAQINDIQSALITIDKAILLGHPEAKEIKERIISVTY